MEGRQQPRVQQAAEQQQPVPELPEPPLDTQQQQQHQASEPPPTRPRLHSVLGGLLCLTAAAAAAVFVRQRRQHGRAKQGGSRSRPRDGRIPLKDLVRFKERQWFVEELETARDGDANSMVRLAKMYLHGQGCQQNIAMAQEWVRRARVMGVPATLDELYATDDPEPRAKLRALAALEERRRSLRKLSGGGAAAAGRRGLVAASAAA